MECQKKNISNWFAYRRKLLKQGKNVGKPKKNCSKPIIKKELTNEETFINQKNESNCEAHSSIINNNFGQNFPNSYATCLSLNNNLNNNFVAYPNYMNNYLVNAYLQNLQRILLVLESPRPNFLRTNTWNY